MNSPKKPTPAQIKAISENYKEMRQNIARAGGLVLQMARHPDMTDAMVLEVVASYRRSYQGLRDVHESLRKHIGPNHDSHWRPHPWEKPL